MIQVLLTKTAEKDLLHWKKSGQRFVLKRIQKLIHSIEQDPYSGIGKPEPLTENHSGEYSRRITEGDRMVYEYDKANKIVYIYSMKGHYEDK